MNFELSLPLIWLAIFGVTSLWRLPVIMRKYGWKKSVLVSILPAYASLSIIWSANKLRGILTAGVLWLIVFSVINLLNLKFEKAYLKRILMVYLASASVAAGFCILQCFLDVWGVSREYTLLCPGCIYTTLGFPHANGFAIEPQFMGNLLIAPALIALALFYNAIKLRKSKRSVFGFGGLSFYFIMSLYICFSRGALYAFGIAGIVFGIILLVRERNVKPFWLLVPTVLGLIAGLLIQGVLAEISPTSENFTQGIQRSIHQITMGKIDIREEIVETGEQSSFTGYIEESTDIRLNITDVAIQTWRENNIFIGVGIGGAGSAMMNKLGNPKEIIQNEYINILTELGLIGVIILIFWAGYVINISWRKISILTPVVLAFLITLGFFSGFPNVLHIYLLPPIFYWFEQKHLI